MSGLKSISMLFPDGSKPEFEFYMRKMIAAAAAGIILAVSANGSAWSQEATARKAVLFPFLDKQTSASTKPYGAIVSTYAKKYGVPVALAHAVIKVESNYNAKARGRAGEVGLMQIKPSTARMLGYSGSVKGLYDPETNIRWGMKYLAMAQDLGGGKTCGTILKYNAGHAAKRMNPVSKAYCGKVLALLD
jgi:soluble lytic murein transglycosylase-like protein